MQKKYIQPRIDKHGIEPVSMLALSMEDNENTDYFFGNADSNTFDGDTEFAWDEEAWQ